MVLRLWRQWFWCAEFYGSFTSSPELQTGKPFAALSLQISVGVLLKCDEGPAYGSFRLGQLGLDKIYDVDTSLAQLENALNLILAVNALPVQDASRHGGAVQSGGLRPIPKHARVWLRAPQP